MKRKKGLLALFLTMAFLLSVTSVVFGEETETPVQNQPTSGTSNATQPPPSSTASTPTSTVSRPQSSSKPSSAPRSSSRPKTSSKKSSSVPQKKTKKRTVVSVSSEPEESSSSSLEDYWGIGELSSTISLPDVGSVSTPEDLIVSGTKEAPKKSLNFWGILSWACIALGILVVVLVLFSTARRPPRGGPGRNRYRRKPYRSRKKHLLNDRYYRDRY